MEVKNHEELKKYILQKLNTMKTVRAKTESQRWEACSFVRHRTSDFNISDGLIKSKKLWSNKAVECFNTLANGIAGYLMSPSLEWFQFTITAKDFTPTDKVHGASDYLEQIGKLTRRMFAGCNFYQSTKLALEDVISQGTSAEMVIDELDDGRVVFDTIDPQEFFIDENHNRKVDTFFREYEITADQAIDKFGDDLPNEVLQMQKKGAGHQLCKFVHAIYPRDNAYGHDGRKLPSTDKPFASVHYSYSGERVFRVSGYDTFPVAVHRWELKGTSPYGTSPVIDILPELREIHELSKQYAIAVQKLVNPPVFLPVELKKKLNLNPGATNYYNGAMGNVGQPIFQQTSLDLTHLQSKIQQIQQSIENQMYVRLFTVLMMQEQQRTATEVEAIKGEGLVLLSSIIGNIQEEKVVPIVLRTFTIAKKYGLLPQPPEEMVKVSGNLINVELSGPLAQSMRAYHQTIGITKGMQAIAGVMQLNPESSINIDFDELLRQAATSNGMPQTIIREVSEVKKIKKQVVQQQQQQQQMDQLEQASKIQQQMGGAGAMAQQQGGMA